MNKNWTLWWLALVLILATVEYRFDLGPISVAIFEPVAVLGALVILGNQWRAERSVQFKEPFLLLFIAITAWALLVRPFSLNWQHGLSDIRDWIIPTLTLLALYNLEKPVPYALFGIIAIMVVGYSGLSIVQHYFPLEALRPFATDASIFKLEILPIGGVIEQAAAGVGFFGSPNGLGMFFALGIPILFGWLRQNGQRFGLARYTLLLLAAIGLYFTYSKMSILIVAAIIGVMAVHYIIPANRTRVFAQTVGGILLCGLVILLLGLEFLPRQMVGTFWWRVALWEIVGLTLRQVPSILLIGNGMDWFTPLSFHGQPHNLYLYMLLEYGIVGLVFTISIMALLLQRGLQMRQDGRFADNPMLMPLWIGLLGQFAIATLETTWLTGAWREFFVITLYLFLYFGHALVPWRFPRMRVALAPSV